MRAPVEALAELAGIMRAIRHHVDVQQEGIAHRMGFSRGRLSHFESARELPSPANWSRWQVAIESAARARQRDQAWLDDLAAKLAHAETVYRRAADGIEEGRRDQQIARGTAPLQPATATFGPGTADPGITDSLHPGHDVGTDVAAVDALRSADRLVGGWCLYPTVVRYLHTKLGPRLFGMVGGGDGKALLVAAASFTEMAGWMAHDAGLDRTAQEHFGRAFDLAEAGGDLHLAAHVLASMSHLAHQLGEPASAVALARRGHAMLVGTAWNPELGARLWAMQARGAAMLEDAAECVRLLRRAEQALDQADELPSPWISRFDHAALAAESARCMRRLGWFDDAQKQVEGILLLRPATAVRSRALGQLLQVSVMIAQGRPDEACALAGDVIAATRSLGSVVVVRQLRGLRSLLNPCRANPVVAAFLDNLDQAEQDRLWLLGGSVRGDDQTMASGTVA